VEAAAIERTITWFSEPDKRHMTIHSDSTSAIARAGNTGDGPGPGMARNIRYIVCRLRRQGRSVDLVWVGGHEGSPGNKETDVLASRPAQKAGYSQVMSISHLKSGFRSNPHTRRMTRTRSRASMERRRYHLDT
jgi:ribonuclease HI